MRHGCRAHSALHRMRRWAQPLDTSGAGRGSQWGAEREHTHAYTGSAGNTTTEPSLSRAISIATSVVRLLTVTPSASW